MGEFGKGIPLASGFDLGAKKPLDSRNVVDTIEERDIHVLENRAYEGMVVYVKEEKKQYRYDGEKWTEDIEALSYTNDNMPNVSNTKEALDTLKEETDSLQFSINEINDGNTGILIQAQNYARTLITELKIASFEIVIALPEINISKTTIYLLRYGVDLYELYIYTVDDKWEKIGTTKFDFSDYYFKEEVDFLLDGKLSISEFNSKKNELNEEINNIKDELGTKVDKVTGKSLVSDEEIARLSNVDNYDDTIIKKRIENLETSEHLHENMNILDTITQTEIDKWNNHFDGNYNNLTNKPNIPTKVSELENDSNFLTSVPSEYITETELNKEIDNLPIQELLSCINLMQLQIQKLQEEVEYLKTNCGCINKGLVYFEDGKLVYFEDGKLAYLEDNDDDTPIEDDLVYFGDNNDIPTDEDLIYFEDGDSVYFEDK